MSDAHRSDLVSWPNGMSHPYSVNCALAHAGLPWCLDVQGPTLLPDTGRPPASSFQQRWNAPPFRPGAARLSSGWIKFFKSLAPFLANGRMVCGVFLTRTVATFWPRLAIMARSFRQILIDRHNIHYRYIPSSARLWMILQAALRASLRRRSSSSGDISR